MHTIFEAAIAYRNRGVNNARYIPNRSCPPLYFNQQSQYFPYIEFSKHKRIPANWFDALAEIHIYIEKMESLMPPLKKKQNKRPDGMPEMINARLSDDELTGFDQWLAKEGKSFDQKYVDVLVSNIKIGMSIDGQNSCFICSFTPKDEDDLNHGKCLISRSEEWQEAFMMNYYKTTLFDEVDGGKWSERNNGRNRG